MGIYNQINFLQIDTPDIKLNLSAYKNIRGNSAYQNILRVYIFYRQIKKICKNCCLGPESSFFGTDYS